MQPSRGSRYSFLRTLGASGASLCVLGVSDSQSIFGVPMQLLRGSWCVLGFSLRPGGLDAFGGFRCVLGVSTVRLGGLGGFWGSPCILGFGASGAVTCI